MLYHHPAARDLCRVRWHGAGGRPGDHHHDCCRPRTNPLCCLAVPFDPVVYDRTAKKEGITVVAPSQIAVDLLGMPGRGPNEAEALIEWMRDIEYAGRA